MEKDVLESYCWMYSSWNIPPQYKGACSSSQVSNLLLDLSVLCHSRKKITFQKTFVQSPNEYKVSVVYNSYYQWVPLYLVFLAMVFYLPRLAWLMIEGGLMKFFGKGTTSRNVEDTDEKRDFLVKFFNINIQNK